MNNSGNFSENLNELMLLSNDIKSDILGKEINVSGQTVRAWCNNTQEILLSHLISLANYFNCSIDFLTGRSDVILDFQPIDSCPKFYYSLRNVMNIKGISRYNLTKKNKIIMDSYLTRWQNGADVHLSSLITLADYLDCSIDFLIGREN